MARWLCRFGIHVWHLELHRGSAHAHYCLREGCEAEVRHKWLRNYSRTLVRFKFIADDRP